jgi:DNA-binding NarL/FixJ family response regulator
VVKPRIVLADDNESVLTALRRLLQPDCDILGCFTTCASMLEAAPTLGPDVVVLDLRMPDMNGFEACRQLKQKTAQVNVVILTASDDQELEERALATGALAFVCKYRIASDLLPAIQGACRR